MMHLNIELTILRNNQIYYYIRAKIKYISTKEYQTNVTAYFLSSYKIVDKIWKKTLLLNEIIKLTSLSRYRLISKYYYLWIHFYKSLFICAYTIYSWMSLENQF